MKRSSHIAYPLTAQLVAALRLAAVLVLLLVVAASPMEAARRQSVVRYRFPTDGVSVAVPSSMQQLTVTAIQDIARWVEVDPLSERLNVAIALQADSTDAANARREAEQTLDPGETIDSDTTVDGVSGVKLSMHNGPEGLTHGKAMMAVHNRMGYVAIVYAADDRSASDILETIRASWKWTPPDNPTRHLEFRTKPIALHDGRVSIIVPGIMKSYSEKAGVPPKLGVFDVRTRVNAFIMIVDLVPSPKGMTLEQYRDRFGELVAKRFKLKGSLNWKAGGGSSARFLAEPFEANMQYNPYAQYGLISAGSETVLVTFTTTAQPPNARAIYTATAEKIFRLITVRQTATKP